MNNSKKASKTINYYLSDSHFRNLCDLYNLCDDKGRQILPIRNCFQEISAKYSDLGLHITDFVSFLGGLRNKDLIGSTSLFFKAGVEGKKNFQQKIMKNFYDDVNFKLSLFQL